MTLENVELFEGISQESIDAMIHCFKAEIRKFRKGDTVIVYSPELEYLCVMLSGKAHLYSVDSEGEDTLLEHYMKDDIFGEVFALPYGSLGYVVEADSDCEVCRRAEHSRVVCQRVLCLSHADRKLVVSLFGKSLYLLCCNIRI